MFYHMIVSSRRHPPLWLAPLRCLPSYSWNLLIYYLTCYKGFCRWDQIKDLENGKTVLICLDWPNVITRLCISEKVRWGSPHHQSRDKQSRNWSDVIAVWS